ncbi:SCO family protein [Pseudonocardia sp. N23]|uniref:SCO family protein n=1 Tax=Pseudonocardia sp. N23 TaxID=1987376 RepID=UPI000BFC071D|nr:SCO family protein [Pseudonocardia sp. N23]GAY07389.1 cytochrome oxidase biogenesis protein Sco1/senc/PrrC, putative copper metallochaperone [Pseudonocardia sp. N23]
MTAPPIRARYCLVDHHGTPVTEASYASRWQLVQFGFTSCKVVCPRALAKLDDALDRLGTDAAAVVPLYVTVDPERDTPQRLKAHLDATHPRFTGLTGTAAQTEAAADAFRVFTRRRDTPDGYDVQHTAITYLLDPSGSPARHWPDTHDAERIAADLTALLR